jgi:hypothetical protein
MCCGFMFVAGMSHGFPRLYIAGKVPDYLESLSLPEKYQRNHVAFALQNLRFAVCADFLLYSRLISMYIVLSSLV